VIGYFLYEVKDEVFPYIAHILVGLGVLFVIYLIVKARKKGNNENK
jgi:hypothetical protein